MSLNWQRVRGQPAHVKQAKCPWCRRWIQRDDLQRITRHQEPTCSDWEALMQRAQRELGYAAAKPIGTELVPFNDDDN